MTGLSKKKKPFEVIEAALIDKLAFIYSS